jgi:hypothetical protein
MQMIIVLCPARECKNHMTPILMHLMHFSMNYVSSVMLKLKILGIQKIMTQKPGEKHAECREVEGNPSVLSLTWQFHHCW